MLEQGKIEAEEADSTASSPATPAPLGEAGDARIPSSATVAVARSIVPLMDFPTLMEQLRRIPVFASITDDQMRCFEGAEQLELQAGDLLLQQDSAEKHFWILLHGGVRVYQDQSDGRRTIIGMKSGSETFGEVALLAGTPNSVNVEIAEPSTFIRLSEDAFWKLMASCPVVRQAILRNMSLRLQMMQNRTLQREKLVSLGTLAAGLMHELNNPGAAAKRAASQLRRNLVRLQQMSLRFSHVSLNQEQWDCMLQLQEQALSAAKPETMNSLEQSDAEEALAEWLDANQVANAWKLAPTLVGIGMAHEQLACARSVYEGEMFSDSLNWLEALVSSMQMVGTIEESVGRVTELVHAVKKYSYEDKAETHTVDVNDSLRSTLLILSHKFRPKEIRISKDLAADLPQLRTRGTGLNQIWTNLLDNAIDAVSPKGNIKVRTWVEGPPDTGEICVSIADDGVGVPEECKAHIFEPFFTTKEVGEGTGLGLDIAHRIVVGQYGGDIRFTTSDNGTEFLIRLPLVPPATSPS